ncbi:MAG: hypothetical protein AAF628_05325 [Planctomycetota bacterium]
MRTTVASLAALSLTCSVPSQGWARVLDEGPLAAAAVYDAGRDRTVAVTQTETWEWDGRTWTRRFSPMTPATRSSVVSMAYDEALARVVLVDDQSQTWTWDGFAWRILSTVGSPVAQGLAFALTFDEARGVTTLATLIRSGELATWELAGSTWTPRGTQSVSGLYGEYEMAFDGSRGRVALITSGAGEHYEWDGSVWQLVGRLPTYVHRTALVHDPGRNRLVMFGGDYIGTNNTTWEWDGTVWQRQFPAASPEPRQLHALVYDRRRGEVVMVGGAAGMLQEQLGPQTWSWDGTRWQQLTTHPGWRRGGAVAFDRARGVVLTHGGGQGSSCHRCVSFGDTWEWDGRSWRTNVGGGPTVGGHAMVYDVARDRTVLHGGWPSSSGQTFEWDGTSWTGLSPGAGPDVSGHAMAYDPVRQRTVLFGGPYGGAGRSKTWEWDGTNWVQLVVTDEPPGTAGHGMTYDSSRGRVVLVSGTISSTTNELWEWDGATWTRVPIAGPLVPFDSVELAFDERRQQLIAFSDKRTWELGAVGWTAAAGPQPPNLDVGMVYDPGRGITWGITGRGEVWAYGATTPASVTSTIGCTAGPQPRLVAFGQPRPGNRSFGADLVRAAPFAPTVVLVAARGASLALGPDCQIGTAPGAIVAALGLFTNGQGFHAVHLPVPAAAGLTGLDLHTQAVVANPAARLGVALSDTLHITVGQ